MYRFLLRPSWLLSHVLVLLLILLLFNLGFWQLRRLDEKRAANEVIEARAAEGVVDVTSLVDPDDALSAGEGVEWRRVRVVGTYEPAEQVLLRSRSLNGQPGFWVLTPLVIDDGSGTIVVNRGWVPFRSETDGSDADFPTPDGPVTVEGLVQQHVGGATPAGDDQLTVDHVDLEWFDDHLDEVVYPLYVQLEAQDPVEGEVPVVLEPPDLTEGPHFGYAMQWFIFGIIAIVGYPIVLVSVARRRQIEGHGLPPDSDDNDPLVDLTTSTPTR